MLVQMRSLSAQDLRVVDEFHPPVPEVEGPAAEATALGDDDTDGEALLRCRSPP